MNEWGRRERRRCARHDGSPTCAQGASGPADSKILGSARGPANLQPNIADIYPRMVERLVATLDNPAARDEAAAAVCELIRRLVLVPGVAWGELDAKLGGDLAPSSNGRAARTGIATLSPACRGCQSGWLRGRETINGLLPSVSHAAWSGVSEPVLTLLDFHQWQCLPSFPYRSRIRTPSLHWHHPVSSVAQVQPSPCWFRLPAWWPGRRARHR